MEYVSNSPFAESEFSKWKKEVYNIMCMVNALDWDMDVWRELARHFNPLCLSSQGWADVPLVFFLGLVVYIL